MPFRLAGAPFKKLRLEWRRGLGADLHPANKPPGVEVLANGNHFVALGVHPGTLRPYEWHGTDALAVPRAELPPLDHATAITFLRRLGRVLERLGAEDVKLTGAPVEKRRPARASSTAAPADANDIAAALDHMGNPDLAYDDWIRIGLALKSALGEGGLGLWHGWSALSSKNDPIVTERKWASFRPTTITAATIFWELRR